MSVAMYIGGADNVRNVFTLTPGGTIEVGDVFIVGLGLASISVSATATTVAQTCLDIYAALTDEDAPVEFSVITWELDNATTPTKITGTGPEDGRPIYASITVNTTEAGGGAADTQTFAKAQVTAATGSKHWDNVNNWSGGAVPVNGDEVYIGTHNVAPQYALDQSTLALDELHIVSCGTAGLIVGLPPVNPNGYVEYLDTMLKCLPTLVVVGEGAGSNVPALRLNSLAGTATAMRVLRTESRDGNGNAPVYWIPEEPSTITDCRGALDVSTEPDDAGDTISTTIISSGGDIKAGPACPMTTITNNGGTLDLTCTTMPTTLTLRDGASAVIRSSGSGTITDLRQDAGSFLDWRATGTVTNYYSSGSLETINDGRGSKTFTNVSLYAGAVVNDPNKVLTFTNGVDLVQCGLADVVLNLGKHLTVQRSAI